MHSSSVLALLYHHTRPRGKRIIKAAVPSRDEAAARRIQETLYVAAAISLATPSITATALSVYEPE